MILIDTSVWIDHLHRAEAGLVDLLGRSQVFRHPTVIGELALGNIKEGATVPGSRRDPGVEYVGES